MPLFSWMKWSHDTREQAQDTTPSLKSSGVVPSRMLITELLWHVEERERLARELEREHRLAHSALGLHWFQKYPRLRTLIPSSELHQLEFLCAQIPPIHAATVLSRCLVAAIPCSVLTLVCCQQWLAATESTLGLTAGKAEKTHREREAGRAAKKAIMCYCHRRRRYRVLTCEGEGHPVRLSEARLTGFPLIISASQFREVLASNNIRPWELAAVFKQVLRDFLDQNEYGEDHDISVQPAQFRPMEAWTSRYKMKQGFVTPTVPNCGDHPREEIPTVSGYVDRAMRHSSSFTATRDWDLPYYYPTPLRPKGAYSTTL